MVPFVERNYNIVELGPRGTGKSHLFQQISPYAHLISGGKATVAKMFVNNATGQRGLVCQYDVVCFDEVSGISFDQKDGVNIMKGYMESGEFSRGKESIRADGGIVMVGNFDVDVEHQQRVGHLLRPAAAGDARTTPPSWTASMPTCPGWDFPKLNPNEHFTDHFGLVSDFLTECWSQLRAEQSGRRAAGPGALRRRAERPRHRGRQQDGQRPAEAALPRSATMPVSDEDLEWVVRLALEVPSRVKEQQKRMLQERVPQHALQLHAGRRRRRAVRVDAGAAQRRSDRGRSTAAWPGVGDQPRRPDEAGPGCTASRSPRARAAA